jgi:hypothetical protein
MLMILTADNNLEDGMFELGIGSISDNINPNLYQNQTLNPPTEPDTIYFYCEVCECVWRDGKVIRVTICPCDAGISFVPGTPTVH